jgi:hypothetical protein
MRAPIVESNIWMRCADELIEASASKKASKTPALLSRSKRFHTLLQGPKRSGRARHRTFSNREEMERFEEAPVILGLPSPSRKAGAKHRKCVRSILLMHLRRHALRPPIRSETYESRPIQLRNPKNIICRKFVRTA